MRNYPGGGDDNIKPEYSQNEFRGVLDLDEKQEILLEMKSIYKRISGLLPELDEKEIKEERFREIVKTIDAVVGHLEICLDCIGWKETETQKFESMYNYYRELKQTCMDKMMEKIDESDFDIGKQLQKMFDFLSDMILKVGEKKISDDVFKKLDKVFVSIKTKLQSDETKEQMTVLEYNSRIDKYNQAMDYVKKIYV